MEEEKEKVWGFWGEFYAKDHCRSGFLPPHFTTYACSQISPIASQIQPKYQQEDSARKTKQNKIQALDSYK